MPGLIRGATAIGTLPVSLSVKFTESHAVQMNLNEYHDGSCQRTSLVTGGRRTWKLSKRLDAFHLGLLRDFYEAAHGGAFYFYNPFEALPPFSHSPVGTSGRYLVRFNSDWGQTNGMARSDADIELIEVADALAMSDVSSVTNSAVPSTATVYLTTAHAQSPDFTPNYGGGASFSGVGLFFPTPDWFHDTASWSKRTDSKSVDANALLNGSLFLLLMLEQDGSAVGPGTAETLSVYDCYAVLTYGDGSTVTYRPTGTAVNTSAGATGTVDNPASAIDGDGTTFALLSCTSYGLGFSGIFLNLNSFRPV